MGANTSMRKTMAVLCVAAALWVPQAVAEKIDWARKRARLGREDKLRVLVDKVVAASNNGRMTARHMDEIRDAGFNVIVPRVGASDLRRVARVAEMARERGMFYMAWMRGTRHTKNGTRLVWENGVVNDLYSPNADELWDWMASWILGHAALSVKNPAIVGSFLDFENYAHPKPGDAYYLSYDEKILAEFAAARKIKPPQLPPARRYGWLVREKLFNAFRTFQINSWRRRCRRLRRQIDAINPRFQLIVYPSPGTMFLTEAAYREWSTPEAPVILADPSLYGRPALVPEATALRANHSLLTRNLTRVRQWGIPLLYMGGLDPIVRGADPEFLGKSAAMSSEVSDGYWVFYEGPKYGRPDHVAYFKWFARANREIVRGNCGLWKQPRKTPEPDSSAAVERKTDKPQLGAFGVRKHLAKQVARHGGFEMHKLGAPTLESLRRFDAVVLQNFNLSLPADDAIVRDLRRYVEGGGGLFLTHDTGWFLASPLPEVAVRARPKHKVQAERHVFDRAMVTGGSHEALGRIKPGTRFTAEFDDHMIFRPGPKGAVLVRNAFGEAVYVAGRVGNGRVVFSGCYFGYRRALEGPEREVFFSVLDWLRAGG